MPGLLALVSAAAVYIFYRGGYLLYYGDAEAHLNIARRIVDSRTPGYDQVGTVWLPLPHWLMLPFVRVDWLWQTGLAGSIPSAICYVLAGTLLFRAMKRAFQSTAAAVTATVLFACNPNLLYLQAIPMTESIAFAAWMGVLFFSVRFRDTQGWGSVIGAALAACAGTLARYDGYFLLPFTALYFLYTARRHRFLVAAVFSAIAGLGPVYWLWHNYYLAGDMMASFTGPYSAKAQMGHAVEPGNHNLKLAFQYFWAGAAMCASPPLVLLAIAGVAACVWKRVLWPVLLLALPTVFYVWAIDSGNTFVRIPCMWPFSYDATRYTLAALPLLAVAPAALVAMAAPGRRRLAAALAIGVGMIWWLVFPQPKNWIVFEEARVNSVQRRAFLHEAAQYIGPRYERGAGVLASFGDLTGIFREAGIPLRETLTQDYGATWIGTLRRPDLLMVQQWAVAMEGDEVHNAVTKTAAQFGIRYTLEKTIVLKNAPAIEIFRRAGG